MPRTEFNESLANGSLHGCVHFCREYLDERLSLLRQALDQTNSLAAQGQLPYAELSSAGLKISPVDSNIPKDADALREDVYGLRWFAALQMDEVPSKPSSGCKRPNSSAHGHSCRCNKYGRLQKWQSLAPVTSLSKLSWLVAWYIRDEPYSKALAEIVNYQHRVLFASHWGEGTTLSSDASDIEPEVAERLEGRST